MLDNLIYAFNAIAPTFTLVIVGMWLKKIGILTDEFVSRGNVLSFRVLIPVLVFFNLYDATGIDFSYIKVIGFCVGVVIVSVAFFSAVMPKFEKDPNKIGVLVQCMYRGNFMLYALPFSATLGGAESVALAISIMAATLPVMNTLAVFVYSAYSDTEADWRHAVKNVLKNPILWGVGAGLLCYALRVPMPEFLHTAGKDIAKTATPLAFIFLGAQFELRSTKRNIKQLVYGILVKLLAFPIFFLFIAIYGFHIIGEQLIPVFIFLAAPTAITNYQLAIQFDADYELAGDFLVFSMAASAFTMFGFIYFLRSFQLI